MIPLFCHYSAISTHTKSSKTHGNLTHPFPQLKGMLGQPAEPSSVPYGPPTIPSAHRQLSHVEFGSVAQPGPNGASWLPPEEHRQPQSERKGGREAGGGGGEGGTERPPSTADPFPCLPSMRLEFDTATNVTLSSLKYLVQ